MRKKVVITVIIVAVIAGLVMAINQMNFIDTLKKMHGG